jgi:hypothetical protein
VSTRFAFLAVLLACRVAQGQDGGWTATPAQPTVGDTVWLTRLVTAPIGWRVRAGKLEPGDQAEALGDASVLRAPGGWLVRYPVALWSPGPHDLAFPPVWRLAPDGASDSIPGGIARLEVLSVIPDSVRQPEPRPALSIVRREDRNPVFPLAALMLTTGLGAFAIAWRRRGPRKPPAPPHAPLEREVPDMRWLAAGEPKAVAARAARLLREAISRLEPRASLALSTPECLAVVERHAPKAPVRALREVLEQLDRVAFASVQGTDVAALAARARTLASELAQ